MADELESMIAEPPTCGHCGHILTWSSFTRWIHGKRFITGRYVCYNLMCSGKSRLT